MQSGTTTLRDRVAVGLTLFFFLAFSLYSFLALFMPEVLSEGFGAPVSDATGILYFRVYLSRNIALILAGVAFVLLGARKPLAILMTLIAGLPVFDAVILLEQFGTDAPVTMHIAASVYLAITSVLLWLRALVRDGSEVGKRVPGQAM